MQEDREGIFDTIIRNKSHYQKRAYQCIKCLVTMFSSCPVALNLLRSTPDFKTKWSAAISWLQEELDRRPFGSTGNQYNYNWSPPAPSNDTSNGYYLERSQSARITLSKAVDLIPEAEKGAEDPEETPADDAESPAGSSSLSSSQSQVTVFEDKEHSRSDTEQRPPEAYSKEITGRELRRFERRRRMALTRPDGPKSDLCDPQSGPSTGLPGLPIRAPSPIPPASDWSQHQPSTSSGVKWPLDPKQKMSSNTWWEKSVESENREDVEEVDEVDK